MRAQAANRGPNAAHLAIMPMGDSNTWGAGNPDLSRDAAITVGYRRELVSLLGKRGLAPRMVGSQSSGGAIMADPYHEGWPGKGIDTILWRVRRGALERYQPDIVLLLIGSNNMWRSLDDRRPIGRLAALRWVARLGLLLLTMWRRSPSTWVIVGKPITPGNALVPLRVYRAGIELLAAGLRIAGARFSTVDLRAENDGMHYTPSGHRAVARIWYEEILRVLPQFGAPVGSPN